MIKKLLSMHIDKRKKQFLSLKKNKEDLEIIKEI